MSSSQLIDISKQPSVNCFTKTNHSLQAKLKMNLLCRGLDFTLDTFKGIKRPFYANQYVYGRTSRGADRIHQLPQVLGLGNGVISAVFQRNGSPWKIKVKDERVFLFHESEAIDELKLPEQPAYFGKILSNGQRSEDFIAVAGEATPGFFIYPECYYFSAGMPCRFCSLHHTRKTAGKKMATQFRLDIVSEAVKLFQSIPWKKIPIISVTTGTFSDNNDGARYTARIIKSIYNALNPKIPIHILAMPPDSIELIELYREAGASSIAFNIEVFDRSLFKNICPGKNKLFGYDKILNSLEYAVNIFGPYNTFCGFVWGLESLESLLEGYRWCLDRGISISSNVFHADQGSMFAKRKHPNEEYVLELCEAQTALYKEFPNARPIFPVSMRSTLDWEIHRGDFR